jgi:hypothetical protein
MTFENRMNEMCKKDRQDAEQFFAMTFDEQVVFSLKNPDAIRAFATMKFCKLHKECEMTGEKFATLHCEPSRSLIQAYIQHPGTRNECPEETVIFAFRHVRMCLDDECENFQKWIDSLRETIDPKAKDMIRRWDNEPDPFKQMTGLGSYQPEINLN